MRLVVGQDIGLGHVEMAADLIPHHLLGNDAIADVGLEILVGDALRRGRLLQILHGGQVILLADIVQPAHQFGFPGNAEVLAFGEQELLIDQVAQKIFFAVVEFPQPVCLAAWPPLPTAATNDRSRIG